ncbi:LysM peptidoglycan-binding domain-containing protein [Paenibacillus sp. WC2504]|uniref:LysM peptidoglycan-binding domain-containing protein n=1 Tax=Paenibacillus sp. WC2504 TaxID=3461403 RepID=UPI0040454ADC
MAYSINLSFNNSQEGFQFPVNPESLEMSGGSNGKTYDIVGANDGRSESRGGEVNVIKGPKLREISFSGIFPAQFYPFLATNVLYEPMYYVRAIENWMATKRPVRFIYAGHYESALAAQGFIGQELNIPVSIEKFKWKESAGDSGDLEFDISFREYNFYAARKAEVKTDKTGAQVIIPMSARRPDERIRPSTYTVRQGDTPSRIAMMFYTDGSGLPDSSRYKDIQKLNGLSDAAAAKLTVGSVIKLPAL